MDKIIGVLLVVVAVLTIYLTFLSPGRIFLG